MQPEFKKHPDHTSVYFWGFLFRQEKQAIPYCVKELNNANITKVSSGGFYFLAANQQGKLWGWGSSKYGRFGITCSQNIKIPQHINLKFKVRLIAAGNWHSLISDIQGNIYSSGHNKYGCLGLGHFNNMDNFTKVDIASKVQHISAGDGFSIMISSQKYLYGCGIHSLNGHSSKQNVNIFKKISQQNRFIKVSCGFTHSLAISQNGQIYSWGEGNFYQLGHGNKNNYKNPKKIQAINGIKFTEVSCTRGQKYSHSMAVSDQGIVYTWGAGYKGKLGHHDQWSHADAADEPLPKKVKTFQSKAKKVLGGGIHSGIVDEDGNLYTFGCGSDGRLGHPESNDHRYLYREGVPRKLQDLSNISCIDASFSYYQNICVGYKR